MKKAGFKKIWCI